MENTTHIFYKQNTPFALLIGFCFMLASYTAYRVSDSIYGNLFLDKTIMFLYIVGLFIQIRQYRENGTGQGRISFGQALVAGIWISTVCSVLYAVYTVLLHTAHPELLEDYLRFVERVLNETYPDSAPAANINKLITAFTTPVTLGFSELFSKMINGTLYSLIIAAILKKK